MELGVVCCIVVSWVDNRIVGRSLLATLVEHYRAIDEGNVEAQAV